MKKLLTVFLFAILGAIIANAQSIDDAIRYVMPNAMNSTRTGALGVSFHGINDDVSALYFNPAGLTLIPDGEVNFGLGFMTNTAETDYLGYKDDYKRFDLNISNFGIAGLTDSKDKKVAFGIGHFYESNYKSSTKISGFNSSSSMIDYETNHGPQPNENIQNWAYELYLADKTEDGSAYETDYQNSLSQSSKVLRNGGLHNLIFGAAIDLTSMFSVGGSVTMKFGGFEYNRTYQEWDSEGNYNSPEELNNFEKLEIEEFYDNSIIGLTAELGMQARVSDFLRVSLGVQMPTWLGFEEYYGADYSATYSRSSSIHWSPYSTMYGDTLYAEYSLITPFVFSGGLSTHFSGLTLTAGAEYANTSGAFFLDPDDYLEETNDLMDEVTQGQLKFGAGFEYMIPVLPMQLRGSYEGITSAYKEDTGKNGAIMQNIAGGMSLFLNQQLRLDLAVRYSSGREWYILYGWDSIDQYADYTQDNTQMDIVIGMAYRF